MAEKEVVGQIVWRYVSTKKLQQVCGVSRQKASKIRNGKASMNLSDYLKLKKYLTEMYRLDKLPKFDLDEIFSPKDIYKAKVLAYDSTV